MSKWETSWAIDTCCHCITVLLLLLFGVGFVRCCSFFFCSCIADIDASNENLISMFKAFSLTHSELRSIQCCWDFCISYLAQIYSTTKIITIRMIPNSSSRYNMGQQRKWMKNHKLVTVWNDHIDEWNFQPNIHEIKAMQPHSMHLTFAETNFKLMFIVWYTVYAANKATVIFLLFFTIVSFAELLPTK